MKKGLSTHSSEMKSTLIDYLKNRLGNEINFENEEFEKYLSNKIDGFCSTAYKKWKVKLLRNKSIHGHIFIIFINSY